MPRPYPGERRSAGISAGTSHTDTLKTLSGRADSNRRPPPPKGTSGGLGYQEIAGVSSGPSRPPQAVSVGSAGTFAGTSSAVPPWSLRQAEVFGWAFAPEGQRYYWTAEWQSAEREAIRDIEAGRYRTYESVEELLTELSPLTDEEPDRMTNVRGPKPRNITPDEADALTGGMSHAELLERLEAEERRKTPEQSEERRRG